MTDPGHSGNPASWGHASGPRAGFWARFGASLIDGLIVGFVATLLRLAIHDGAGDLLSVGVSAGYFTFFEGGRRGAGFGKQAMGIRVIDAHTGDPIGHPRALLRWVAAILSTLVIFMGFLWMLWDREHQCWHDKIAGDVVVPTADYPPVNPAQAPS
jgi:uncharacterized RDD family membrane protein YckC